MGDTKWTDAKQALTDRLAAQLTEFFQAYVLVGFTMDGERVKLSQAPRDMHVDALQQLLEDTVSKDFKLCDTVTVTTPPTEGE